MSIKYYTVLLLTITISGMLFLHQSYPLDYIYRVLSKQESDTNDINWKPSIRFDSSNNQKVITLKPDEAAVGKALGPLLNNLSITEFMESSGTTSFLVYRDSTLVFEQYFNGANSSSLHATFSISKSVFSIVLGQSVKAGLISSLNDPITKYIPEYLKRDSRFEQISLANLLDMRSGLHFDSDVSFPFFTEDKPLIYYATDLRKVLLKRPTIEEEPGQFLYNDFNPNIIGLALQRVPGESFENLVQEGLWNPMGAEYPALWATDYEGFPLFESGLAATARDLLRIGVVMLEAHNAGDDDLIDLEWLKRSTEFNSNLVPGTYTGLNWEYQNGWWLIPQKENQFDILAMGHLGQYVYISPAHNAIIVRTGHDRGQLSDEDFIAFFNKAVTNL